MELILVGASIIASALLADLFFKLRKKGKLKNAVQKPVDADKRKPPVDLLKELRSKAYL